MSEYGSTLKRCIKRAKKDLIITLVLSSVSLVIYLFFHFKDMEILIKNLLMTAVLALYFILSIFTLAEWIKTSKYINSNKYRIIADIVS